MTTLPKPSSARGKTIGLCMIVKDESKLFHRRLDSSGNNGTDRNPPAKVLLYHFQKHLSRKAIFDFPGWYRLFAFAARGIAFADTIPPSNTK
jgi:hypothetical protein